MNGTKGKMAAAFKDLVCRKSFQKITISDITTESAMTRENFYYHFRDKYDITGWIFEQEIIAVLPPDEEPFEEWLNVLFSAMAKDYKYYRKLIKEMDVDVIRSAMQPVFEHRVRILVQESMDDSLWNMRQEKEDFAVTFFTDAFLGFYMNYILDNEDINLGMLKTGLDFVFDQFLSFVRISKENPEESIQAN